MTSELRDAVEVWRKAVHDYGGASIEGTEAEYRAAAVIEADREAVRAEQAAELAKFKALAETLASDIRNALSCTPIVRDGKIIYDCGNPWEILSAALRQYKEARDAS